MLAPSVAGPSGTAWLLHGDDGEAVLTWLLHGGGYPDDAATQFLNRHPFPEPPADGSSMSEAALYRAACIEVMERHLLPFLAAL